MTIYPCPPPCNGVLKELTNKTSRYGFRCTTCSTIYAAVAHVRPDGSVVWCACRPSQALRDVLNSESLAENVARLRETGFPGFDKTFVAEIVPPEE